MIFNKFLMLWFKRPIWQQILIALISGVFAGFLFGPKVNVLKPLGTIFIHAIHLIIVPVVFTAIVGAVLSVGDFSKLRGVISKAFLAYFICMIISASIGLTLATLFAPGQGFHPFAIVTQPSISTSTISFQNFITNLVPSNFFKVFVSDNVLQLVVLAILFGLSVKFAGKEAEPIVKIIRSLNKVVFKLAHIVISFAPYGIFALIAWTFGNYGYTAIKPLLLFVGTVYLGCLIQVILVYSLGLILNGHKPSVFFKGIFPALAFAYTTSSSAATLPLSMKCSEINLGVPSEIARFLLPLGSSFNLNGLSIYLSVATIFAANMFGIHLSLMQYFTIVMTITFTAMGAAAVPGSALIVMGAVMSSVGIPVTAIGIIAGVDRLNDMAQTATNVAGDIFVTTIVGAPHEVKEPLNDYVQPMKVADTSQIND